LPPILASPKDQQGKTLTTAKAEKQEYLKGHKMKEKNLLAGRGGWKINQKRFMKGISARKMIGIIGKI
jgi:hypothetical protein